MASAAGGEGGAAREELSDRASLVVLSACGLLTAIAAIFALPSLSSSAWLQLALPLPVLFALVFSLTRHAPLAAAATFAPAAGVIWGVALSLLFDAPLATPALAIVFGSVLAIVHADNVAARVLDGDEAIAAARVAALGVWRPLLGGTVLAFAMLAVVVGDPWFRQVSLSAFLQFALAGAAVIVLPTSAAVFFKFSEAFVPRLNRLREARTRNAYPLSLIAMPRWGLSVSGIGLVAAVLGFFGAEEMLEKSGFAVPIVLLLAFLLSFGLSGRWRNALALLFAIAVTGLIGFWCWTETDSHGLPGVIVLTEAVAIGFTLMLAVVGRERTLSAQHNDSVARLLAIEETAAPVVYSLLAMVVPAIVVEGGGLAAIVLVSGGVCALLLAPAAATAFETLLPRRKSVRELYSSHS
jgi:hypothetical protein